MFGTRKTEDEQPNKQENAAVPSAAAPRAVEAARSAPVQLSPRRAIDIPGGRRKDEERTLRVGRGLSLAGEITSCDVLVVEGKVEAKLSEGKLLEITEAGQFRGSVEIENADIAGRYDGQLIVHGRLTVRSTGRISGMVKYGELEVSAGGQIIGEVQVAGVQAGNNFKSAAKFASGAEEEETETQANKQQRKSA